MGNFERFYDQPREYVSFEFDSNPAKRTGQAAPRGHSHR